MGHFDVIADGIRCVTGHSALSPEERDKCSVLVCTSLINNYGVSSKSSHVGVSIRTDVFLE